MSTRECLKQREIKVKCSIVPEEVWKKEQRNENENLFNKNEIDLDAYCNIDHSLITILCFDDQW